MTDSIGKPLQENETHPAYENARWLVAEHGFAIFPCHSIERGSCTCSKGVNCSAPGKHPRTARGVLDATTNVAVIGQWHTTWPETNWGVTLGERGFVVDADVKGAADGVARLDEWGDLPTTLTAISGGGGRHYYFLLPNGGEGVGNRTNWLPGVDVRAAGGYVLVPGSKHVSGGSYGWSANDRDVVVATAPSDLVLSIRQDQSAGSTTFNLGEALTGLPEGERDAGLFRMACSLRRRLGDEPGAREVVTLAILAAAERCTPPFPEAEALRKVEQAYRMDHSDTLEAGQQAWVDGLKARDVGAKRERAVAGGSFILDQPEQIPAVWGSGQDVLWAEGEGFMIAGHQGLGKTTIGQQLCLAMMGVRDETFLGLPVPRREGRILYLAMDRPRQAARSFRRMVSERDRQTLNDRLTIWKGPLPINPTDKGAFASWVKEVAPDVSVVVVDSVKDLAPGITDDAIASALNSSWQSVITEGIDLLLLHHQRKASDDSKRSASLDSVYGSTWLTSGLGSVVVLTGDPGSDEVVLHHVKQPAETVGPLDLTHDHPRGRTTCVVEPIRMDVEGALRMAPQGGHTIAALAKLTGLSEKTVRKRINDLGEAVEKIKGTHTSEGRIADTYRLVVDLETGEMTWS